MAVEILANGYEADLTADIAAGTAAPFDISVSTLNDIWGVAIPALGQFRALVGRMPAGVQVNPAEVELMVLSREGAAAGKLRVLERDSEGSAAIAHSAADADVKVVAILTQDGFAQLLDPKIGHSKQRSTIWRTAVGTVGTNFTPTVGRGYAVPAMFGPDETINRLRAEVVTASGAGGLLRLMAYEDDGTGYPGALLLDGGTVAANTIGTKTISGLSKLAPGGLAWLVVAATVAAPAMRGLAAIAGLLAAHPDGTDLASNFGAISVAGFGGAPPNPFPIIDTLVPNGPRLAAGLG